MSSRRAPWIAVAVALAIACSGSETQESQSPIVRDPSTGSCPEPKLVLHPDGIPGQYIVVLLESVTDVAGTADALAAKYDGTVLNVYASALRGFSVRMPDANAPLLAAEPLVCWVEQDGIVSAD